MTPRIAGGTAIDSSYNAHHLLVLEGLEAVRKRPGMYIGSTDSRGLMHCLWEIIDNGVDEALAGAAHRVEVSLHRDGSAEVHDDGRGIPIDKEPKTGLPGVEVVATKLHAGGKFGGGSYVATGGLHGVGLSVVNALSARMDIDVEPRGQRVDHRRPDAVQSPRGDVRAPAELPAGVQLGEDHLHPGEARLGLLVDGDAAPVVVHLGRAVGVQRDLDVLRDAGERLVHPVVDDLPEAVHESAGIGRPDVHARALADRLEAFEDQEVCGVVRVVDRWLQGRDAGLGGLLRIYSRHAGGPWRLANPRRV